MSHTDLGQPDLAALGAAGGTRNSRRRRPGPSAPADIPLTGADPLARDLARSLAEAGFTLHHCATQDPLYRLGVVLCLRVSPEAEAGQSGISVSWNNCDLLLRDQRRHRVYRDTRQAMNAALGCVLTAFGYQVTRFGCGGAWLVTGRPPAGTRGRTMTALAITPETGTGYGPVLTTGVDRAIRASAAVAVLAVAGVAAYVSCRHAYAVVCAHGETGGTARLEPATIDGLVYASSMVNLYAAQHRLPVPALARWLLPLGTTATLAASMAQGWSHGPVGALIAARPAVSLVGSYELSLGVA